MAVLGMRGTGSFSSDERPTNFREAILREYPGGGAVLTMILGMLKSESVDDPKFTIFEQGLPTQVLVVGAGYNTTATTITLSTTASDYTGAGFSAADAAVLASNPGRNFKAGHMVRNDTTEEIMHVTGRSDSTITVERGVGDVAGDSVCTYPTTGIAGTQGDTLTIVGSSHEEGADYPTSVGYDPSTRYNYIQTFRTSMTLTDDAAQTYYRTGNINETKKFDCAMEHSIEMEKAFLWVHRELMTGQTNGQPQRTTGGCSYFVTSNTDDFSSTGLTKTGLNNFLRPIYIVPGGTTNKLALCGAQCMGVLNDYAEAYGHMNVEPRGSTYGLQIRTLVHAWGELSLVNHPLMSEHPVWTKAMFIIDTRNIKYRYLRGRDTRFLKNRQGNGEDMVVHEYMTKAGLELQHERTHGIATGIDTFIA